MIYRFSHLGQVASYFLMLGLPFCHNETWKSGAKQCLVFLIVKVDVTQVFFGIQFHHSKSTNIVSFYFTTKMEY